MQGEQVFEKLIGGVFLQLGSLVLFSWWGNYLVHELQKERGYYPYSRCGVFTGGRDGLEGS